MRVKIGDKGDYNERRFWMGEITYSWGDNNKNVFKGINILVWPKDLEPGTATIENVKLHAIAAPDAFAIKDEGHGGMKYKGKALAINKSQGNLANKKTKATLGEMVELKIRPRQRPRFGGKANEKVNYWSWFIELEECLEYFKAHHKYQTEKNKQQYATIDELKAHLDSKQDPNAINDIANKAQVTKKDRFGNSVEQMKTRLKTEFQKMGDVPRDQAKKTAYEKQRYGYCYYESYLEWNGDGFQQGRLLRVDPTKYLNAFIKTMETIHKAFGDEKKKGSDKQFQFKSWDPIQGSKRKRVDFWDIYKHDKPDIFIKKAREAILQQPFIQIEQSGKQHLAGDDEDPKSDFQIRITIIPGKEKEKEEENSAILWELITQAFLNRQTSDREGPKIFTRGRPHWAKVHTPGYERVDGIILTWYHERSDEIDYNEARRRIHQNRMTYNEICHWLSTYYADKLYDPKALPPFQFKKPGCPASIASYCGGQSFGDKLCYLIAEKGDVDQNVLKYADSGSPMEEYWTFADYMNCKDGAVGK
eukprot:CAMPEP_0197516080 /NCGR_PEP_ID=MMETSP1318-20131121/978_1 /TAXON_ID=552666 /ORGANISM="Partenskyella glossopodia, Strain RCC365" /LENGTH=531 /DNA_ID=CAMNT_0043064597 /DNA_START=199 /DNA_END=1794 /DNA_ORIENTATION=-